jgi:hypothetical protein
VEAGFTIHAIIVRILRDAWMVAPGLVPERGDRVRGDRIPQRFCSRALSGRWIRGIERVRITDGHGQGAAGFSVRLVSLVDAVTVFSSRTFFAEREKKQPRHEARRGRVGRNAKHRGDRRSSRDGG